MNNSNVKVAVRVRPLNQREEGLNSECVVRVSGNQITLLPPISCKEKARKEPHTFTYDNCFWTDDRHDTGQEDVFEHLGDGVLENIWLGYNVCMFAYGQTGSGKTFSMMGTEDQPGIVPKICSALFNKESNDLETIRIEASYFEIYNEKVRDLLRSEEKQGKLRVREDRLLGPYVEELSCHAVQSYEEIKLMLDQGNKQRAIAETKMNEQSSRSHSILTLTVTQICNDPQSGASRELVSKVSLVDLAGSERSYKSGAKGSQLKECCNINKSLLTLGLVINSLAKISENKMKSQHVKYRNSVLTWLLKNNLGGNSKTIMLATVSPAADNYQETLSTLRYAESTKRIVNQAMVNKDVKSKAIEKLQEEIKKLREQLTTTEHVKEAEVQKLKSQLEEKKNLLNVLETSWEEKLKRTEVATKEWQKNLENMGIILKKQNVTFSNECYLIQRDTSLIIHNINDITKIGSGPSQDIQISGPEAECEHCVIRKTEGEVFLIAVNNSKIYVNGCLSKTKTQLWHEDKIHIGTNVFDLHQPSRPKPEHMKTNVSSEAEVQTYDELNTENVRSSILSEREGWNSNMIENEKSKTKSAFYKATESSAPTIPASDDDLNSTARKQISDMFTPISNESNSQPIEMKVNTTKSEYLEIGDGTKVQDYMVPCSPQYGEASSQTSEILRNSNCLQKTIDLEEHSTLPRFATVPDPKQSTTGSYIDKSRELIKNFSFNDCKLGNQGYNRVLLQLFGLVGNGKSAFINSCIYALGENKQFENWAKALGGFSGETQYRTTYQLTETITIVDNRGMLTLCDRETVEIYAQLGNLLPLNEPVEWFYNYETYLNRILDRNMEKNTDFIVPVLVQKAGCIYDKEKEEYRIMLDTARKLTGVTPVIILTRKSRGEQSKERSFFEDLGIAPQNIYTIENYTKEDHWKSREKDEQILKILLHIIEDVKFAVRFNRAAEPEKNQRLTFVLNHLSKMKIEEETAHLLRQLHHQSQEKTSAKSGNNCIVS
ncbi:kinesin-like protein KIF13A [Aquarana catesbeiana]|uniref:kinesin-like protein KIF13A n=1 Tax=Aquarana catesbeiana TaxID=8400 RepID=UPI003CCA4D86